MKYFQNCHSLDELKKEYRRLAMLNHPDMGGDAETMKAINNEYEQAQETLKSRHNAENPERQTTETAAEYINIINALIHMHGLTIELCGSWLWIGGDTYANRDALKSAGCRWSSGKKLWYWHHSEDGSYFRRGTKTIGEIRARYGSYVISDKQDSPVVA